MGVHTALDTNGFLGSRLTDDDLQLTDLVLLDIKAWGNDLHRRLVGADSGPVLDFARRLATLGRPVWIRHVLVPGLTDRGEDISSYRGVLCGSGQRAASGRPAVSPDGRFQVETAWNRLYARRCRAAFGRASRECVRNLQGCGPENLLTTTNDSAPEEDGRKTKEQRLGGRRWIREVHENEID